VPPLSNKYSAILSSLFIIIFGLGGGALTHAVRSSTLRAEVPLRALRRPARPGADMGAELEGTDDGTEWIEDQVKKEQKPSDEQTTLEKEIEDKQTQIDDLKRRIGALEKMQAAATDPATRQQLLDEKKEKKKIQNAIDAMEERLRNFPYAQLKFLQKQIVEKEGQAGEQNRAGADPREVQRLKNELEKLDDRRDKLGKETGKKAKFNAAEAQAMALLVEMIDAEKEAIGWTRENPNGLDVSEGGQDESETLKLLRGDLRAMYAEHGCAACVTRCVCC